MAGIKGHQMSTLAAPNSKVSAYLQEDPDNLEHRTARRKLTSTILSYYVLSLLFVLLGSWAVQKTLALN
jgi:hypothetical protein